MHGSRGAPCCPSHRSAARGLAQAAALRQQLPPQHQGALPQQCSPLAHLPCRPPGAAQAAARQQPPLPVHLGAGQQQWGLLRQPLRRRLWAACPAPRHAGLPQPRHPCLQPLTPPATGRQGSRGGPGAARSHLHCKPPAAGTGRPACRWSPGCCSRMHGLNVRMLGRSGALGVVRMALREPGCAAWAKGVRHCMLGCNNGPGHTSVFLQPLHLRSHSSNTVHLVLFSLGRTSAGKQASPFVGACT